VKVNHLNRPFKGREISKTDGIRETGPHINDSASKKTALALLHLSLYNFYACLLVDDRENSK